MKIEHIYFDKFGANVTYYIGKNSTDNFDAIDMSKNPDDIWFHITNISSAHVVMILPIIDNITTKLYHTIVKRGALLCKENTKKVCSMGGVNITYTKIKNVEKGQLIGSVIIQTSKNIVI
jgi:predicted ribosome quality control (RQC) complex YloA/Tae2 family protein